MRAGSPGGLAVGLPDEVSQFSAAAGEVVETLTGRIARRELDQLVPLTSPRCLHNLRTQLYERFSQAETSLLAVQKKDVIFHCVDYTSKPDTVNLIVFSIENLENCKMNTTKLQNYQNKTTNDLKLKGGVLQREDFNPAKFREIHSNFEKLNPSRLVQENSIQITNCVLQWEAGKP